jgi:hypothetical protein
MLGASSGTLSGTPAVAGNYSFSVTATDSGSPTALTSSASFSIAIAASPAIVFSNGTLPSATVNSSYTASVSATGGSGTITYSLTGTGTLPNGLNLASTGAITGTPTATGTSNFTVKAADTYGDAASANFSITVNTSAPTITSTNLPSATVNTAYSYSFQASGGVSPYTWALASNSGPLPSGVTLSSAGLLSGTATAAASYPFTVQVTDSAGNSASAPYTLIVNGPAIPACTHDGSGNSVLTGNYAFLLAGFDPNGSPYQEIGEFAADGAGNISGGNADVNGISFAGTQTEQQYTFSGTYSIGSTDDRGIATVTNTNTAKTGLPSTSTYCFAADAINSGVANSGRILETDASGFVLTGFFQIQDPADFATASIDNGYVFGVQGFNTGSPNPSRTAAIGQISFNGAGGVTSGQIDFANLSGTTTQYNAQIPLVTASSNYSMASNGRGTLTLAVSNGSQTESVSFVVYMIGAAGKLLLLSTDASGSLLVGQAYQQTQSSFQASDLSGGAVYRETRTTSPTSSPLYDDVRVGRYGFSGSGSVGEIRDENSGGVITLAATKSGTYTVSNLGYLTITGTSSNAPNFYLYAPNAGFGLDASGGIGFYLMLAQEKPSGGFATSTLSGSNFSFGTIAPVAYNVSSSSNPYPVIQTGAVIFDSNGTLTGTSDSVAAPGGSTDLSLDQTFSSDWAIDTTSTPSGSTTGRILSTTGSTTDTVGYMVSATQGFLIHVTSGQDSLIEEIDLQ